LSVRIAKRECPWLREAALSKASSTQHPSTWFWKITNGLNLVKVQVVLARISCARPERYAHLGANEIDIGNQEQEIRKVACSEEIIRP